MEDRASREHRTLPYRVGGQRERERERERERDAKLPDAARIVAIFPLRDLRETYRFESEPSRRDI